MYNFTTMSINESTVVPVAPIHTDIMLILEVIQTFELTCMLVFALWIYFTQVIGSD